MASWSNLTNLRLKMIMARKKAAPEQKFLQPIKNLEPEESDSDVSDISDVFEEFHRNSYLQKQSGRYLSKHEADVKTMDGFTDAFKSTMASIRHNLDIGPDLFVENSGDNTHTFPKITVSDATKHILDQYTIPSLHDLTRKESDTSSESLLWHMLSVNSDKKFQISPPQYNTFQQEQRHWSQRVSVSWDEIDQATIKCENWLQKCD